MLKNIIKKMTLEEKIAICSGKDFWYTKSFEKYGIKSIMMTDGPHGLRKQKDESDMLGINKSEPSTCFPTAVTSGATWNKKLIREVGKAIGEGAKALNIGVVLGPGVNIKRNPLCGRNFEYFSEDPYIAGEMGAAYVKGLQSTGIGASLKHFAANNQEYKRFSSDSQIDERTLREIYLSSFEKVVKEAKPATVMSAYNKINGTYCSDSKELLTDILRDEWGFNGMVVTDWGGMGNRISGFKAGCDLSMPGGSAYQEDEALEAVKSGKLSEECIDKSVERILKVVFNATEVLKGNHECDLEANDRLAERVCEEGAVLLKNEDNILPINKDTKVALIGHMAKDIRYQGAGSSHINPSNLKQAIEFISYENFVEGCNQKGEITDKQLNEVTKAASNSDVAVVFAGLTENYESEGFDRENMSIPEGHNKMIEAAIKGNKNTIVILMGGSVMMMPWLNKVKAVLYMGLCGQAGGKAIADILYGNVCPSGKLTETWPLREEDVPSFEYYAGDRKNAQYREGIYVGYRYYDKAKLNVQFPFGYGLSYTRFDYSDITSVGDNIKVTITNSGDVAGAEIVQLYVNAPQNGIYRPLKELKGFEKVFLNPRESKTVEFKLDDRSFALYQNGWKVQKGIYKIMIGASSRDIRLSLDIEKDGKDIEVPSWQKGSWYETLSGKASKEQWELLMGRNIQDDSKLEKGNFTIDNTLMELRDFNMIAKSMCSEIENGIAKGMGIEPDYSNTEFKMAAMCSVDCAMRSMILTSCGKFPAMFAEAILKMANGEEVKDIEKILQAMN